MAGQRKKPEETVAELEAAEDHGLNELAVGYLEEFGGGINSITPGFLNAYRHAEKKGNQEKACVLFAMNHGTDEEFQPEDG